MSAHKKDVHVDFMQNFESIRDTKEYQDLDPEEKEEYEHLYEISKKRTKSREYEKAKEEEKKKDEDELPEDEKYVGSNAKVPKKKKEEKESSLDPATIGVLALIGAGLYFTFAPDTSKKPEVKSEPAPEVK